LANSGFIINYENRMRHNKLSLRETGFGHYHTALTVRPKD
jgi:hypothetical protein